MWRSIFWFEIRYELRQPLFYLVTFFFSVLLFAAGTGHGPGGAVGKLHLNAPAVTFELLVKGIYLVLFLMIAFVASAAVRDFDRRTSELFFSMPISRFDYLTGRFAGTMVVCSLTYLIGAGTLAVSSLMPWLDPARIGPFRLAPYAFGLGVLILPTLFALGAMFYALASSTRSTLATYLGAVGFFAASAIAGMAASSLESEWIGQMLDPFGVEALRGTLEYWTIAELNTALPEVGGTLLWNRILWLGLGLFAFGLCLVTFDPSRPRRHPDRGRVANRAAAPGDAASRVRLPEVSRVFSRRSVAIQFLRQVRHEAASVLGNLPFLGILALGLFVVVQAASSAGNVFGMPAYPRTHLMLDALQGGYSILLLIVAVLYSGHLIWKERSLELDEIYDSAPTPNSVYLGAKLTALLLIMAFFLLGGVLATICVQLSQGYADLELGLYARGAVLAAVYPVLISVLACFFHVVASDKIVGYGLMIVLIVGWDVLEEFGFEHHLYRFASLPPTPYSDFNGYGHFLTPFGWYGLYWGFACVVLLGLSVLFWKRGTDVAWRSRWAEARARFRSPVRTVIVLGVVGLVATGSWIFYNTNVLNEYLPSTKVAERRARYERLYRTYEDATLPRITAVRADVDIFPDQRRVEVRGSYRIENESGEPIRDLHLSLPAGVGIGRLQLPPHEVTLEDDELGYAIYRLKEPLEPGTAVELGFDLTAGERGFVNHGAETSIVGNGSFFSKRDLFPVIGYDARRQLTDRDERRRHGLEPVLRFAEIDDLSARRNTVRASDADWVAFETTVSTSADQIAVTSGELQREWVDDGRRYFHYRTEVPITHLFAYVSATYEVTRDEWNGVGVEVYHHPGHDDNVGRMIDAVRKSLAYLTANFGPYQHRHLRIVEFPRYVRDAKSFPGMIAFSEAIGFNARLDGVDAIDYPFYVTAHEVAHHWWGQQMVGADVQGAGMLHETLAQYSALMVMEDEHGAEGMRRLLKHELDRYLRGRSGERGEEPPLALVERQEYVYYHKGALAMYALRDAVGEERLNRALSRFLSRVAFQEPPFTTTAELLDEIRRAIPERSKRLVEDLFETITVFDNQVAAATYTERPDGTFSVRLDVEAGKLRADGDGVESEIPIDDWIDIAVFGEEEESGEVTEILLFLEKRRIRAPQVAFEIVVDRRPVRAGIDPYHKLVDRDSGDNVRDVSPAVRRAAGRSSASAVRPTTGRGRMLGASPACWRARGLEHRPACR